MPNTLIIGYGNPLRGDDGVGWRVAERLRAAIHDPDIEILAVHQLTPELMDPISRAGRVIFIDAAAGPVPGEIQERTVEPHAAAGAAFSHHATPAALLAGARTLYGRAPQATLLTVAGADFSLSDDLSPAVGSRVDAVVEAALGSVRRQSGAKRRDWVRPSPG
jgi:hydrogenase maturation protease